jgi:UDP-glucose 4-epimerase
MAAIAITGATGFIGQHLCRSCESAGHRPVPIPRFLLASGDLAALTASLRSVDAIVHLAGRAHVLHERTAEPAREFQMVNVGLAEFVARAALDAGVWRFVFVSSAGVLGNSSGPEGLDDDAPTNPHDGYTRSKLQAEKALGESTFAPLELAVIRPALVYGPGAGGNFRRLLRAAASGLPLPVGALRAPRSMVGVRNLCDLLLAAACHPRAPGLTAIAADDEAASVAELVRDLARLSGRKPFLLPMPPTLLRAALRAAGRGADVVRLFNPFVLHATAAQTRLGWKPPHTLQAELEWTVVQERNSTRVV